MGSVDDCECIEAINCTKETGSCNCVKCNVRIVYNLADDDDGDQYFIGEDGIRINNKSR